MFQNRSNLKMCSIIINQKEHSSFSGSSQERKSSLRSASKSASDFNSKLLRKHGITHNLQIKLFKLKINEQRSSLSINKVKVLDCLRSQNNQEPDRQYKCKTCRQKSKTKKGCRFHLKAHSSGKQNSCPYPACKYRCQFAHKLKVHTRIHSAEKPYQCQLCDYKAKHKSNLRSHILKHKAEKFYACPICPWKTIYQGNLKLHMQVHHQNPKERPRPFPCTFCPYAAYTRRHAQVHMRIHTGEKPYKCKMCPYALKHSGDLKNHLRTHTKEKPYKCNLCPYACTTNRILLNHMRSHTGERPFACEQCDYRATQRGHLNTHFQRFHTEEGSQKNVRCPLCTDKFYYRSALASHLRRHTGEKPYKCRFCNQGFTQPGNNLKHERRHCRMRQL